MTVAFFEEEARNAYVELINSLMGSESPETEVNTLQGLKPVDGLHVSFDYVTSS